MPLTHASAKRLMQIIEACGNNLLSQIPELEKELTPEELKVMRREIGRIITTMDSSISAKVAFAFPDLAPEAAPIAHELK